MALITCNECGRQISDRASSCPGCGAPVAGNVPVQQQRQQLIDAGTAKTAVTGLAAWLVAPWIGRALFAIAALIFLGYLLTSGR